MENFCFDIPSDLVGVLYDSLYCAFERRSHALAKMKDIRSDCTNPSLDSNLVNLEFLLHQLNIQHHKFLESHVSMDL